MSHHHHDHGHDHAHGHHHHHHATGNLRTAFLLNLGFTVVEFVGGLATGSTAILADAVHDLGDSIALGQAWYFEKRSSAAASARYSYGYQRFTLVGAFISTILLLASSLFVLSQAVPRIMHPESPHAEGMVVLAVFGVGVNLLAMSKLSKESGMNARVVALHLLEDVLGWVAVLVVAIVLLFVDLPVLDPILAVLITLYILSGVVKNLRKMVPVFLQAVPDSADLDRLVAEVGSLRHVGALHHAHLWSLDGSRSVFTAHVVVDRQLDPADYGTLKTSLDEVVRRHGIYHSTIEIEYPGEPCRNLFSQPSKLQQS